MGDFNLPDVDWRNIRATNNSTNYKLLLDVIQDNFLSQLVGEPIRDRNILDLVLATSADIVQDLLVSEPFSDHNLITFSVTTSPVFPCKSQKLSYASRKADWDRLRSLFSYTPGMFSTLTTV